MLSFAMRHLQYTIVIFLLFYWRRSLTSAQTTNILYPYGTNNGDATAPVNDDGSTSAITLSTGFPYFDQLHTRLYVNTNGALSFLGTVSTYTPQAFPLDSNRRLIAPFWADVDTTENHGRVFYRQTTDLSILNRATSDIRAAFVSQSKFTASWAFVCTYDDVTYFGGSSITNTNTFQVVLVTNGRHSFAIFNYKEVTWTTGTASGGSGGLGGTPAQVGFNAGDGLRYFSVPGSRTSAIVDVETTTNVNVPGRWIFRVDDIGVEAGGCNMGVELQISPVTGNALGGTEILVSGPCFLPTDQFLCKFDDIVVPGHFVNTLRMACYSPPLFKAGKSEVLLQVSQNGGQNFTEGSAFVPDMDAIDDPKIVRVDEEKWDDKGPYVIQWDPGDLVASTLDLDLLTFSDESLGLREKWINIATNIANNGTEDLDDLLNTNGNFGDIATFGAIRLTPAGSASGPNYTTAAIWSDIHVLQWYINAYIATKIKQDPQNQRKRSIIEGLAAAVDEIRFNTKQIAQKTWTAIKGEVKEKFRDVNKQMCQAWFDSDSKQPLPTDLPPCPVRLRQAIRDRGTFSEDPACRMGYPNSCGFHPGASHCVRSNVCSPSGAGQQCCYSRRGSLLNVADGQLGGGTLDRAHYKGCLNLDQGTVVIPYLDHFLQDVLPYYHCCKYLGDEQLCQDTYMERRPSDDGSRYRPPRPAVGNGDPHIITLDGLRYTFNGAGEYTLVKTNDDSFTMQGRAETVQNAGGGSPIATGWTAFAFKGSNSSTVEVRTSLLRVIDVLVGGVRIDFDELGDRVTNYPGLTIERNMNTSVTEVDLNNDGVSLTVTHVAGIFNFMLLLPESMKHKTEGLLGSWNDNSEDDLVASSGVMLQHNSSTRIIHYNFGETWRTTSATSLFTYDVGTSHSTYQNTGFVPLFEVSLASANTTELFLICGDNDQCIFDYVSTGNTDIAQATKSSVEDYDTAVTDTEPVVLCPRLETPPNGQKNVTSGYTVGAEVTFACDNGYNLQGSASRTCLSSGRWNGENSSCQYDGCSSQNGGGNGTDVTCQETGLGLDVIIPIAVAAAACLVIIITVITCVAVKSSGKSHTTVMPSPPPSPMPPASNIPAYSAPGYYMNDLYVTEIDS
ncbi:sushi domain-containing protein 2 [Lingula anatina]|uniref:Sushi domain-containing protein 2 n=1 Tax=Lingula anatina TaxID=7574 RepID=A0A1S3K997_LINAN|nr:sushi domain-containing protein 2 [Lingula anatina]|eukprot:XP_013419198.1 sushi domain-containing protein 2 [Lingula anatina]